MKAASVKPVRCAIYTRVSTEHGLDQEFNSLDAQYEAASAYIKSQAHAGWSLIRSRYDDGGYSGGSTDRPDLQKLLDDIRSRKIDVIVVYKADRLTRSLTDFAKLVELFDTHSVSFVSVTQQFNTTTFDGSADTQRPFVLCQVRARGHLGAYPRQDRSIKAERALGRRHPALWL
jgi:DNA invertase Pin-like site-specific DNA recombinase